MISKLKEPEIEKENPFKNCKLNRFRYGEILTQVVSTYSDGYVMAINGKWGSGKTTFVKMWKQYLEDQGFKTLYFNAWEDDFVSDPLVGLVAKFKEIDEKKEAKTNFSSIVTAVGKLSWKLLPAIVKGRVKKYTGEDVAELVDAVLQPTSELFVNEIEAYEQQSESIKSFREAVSKFVEEHTNGKPLIFMVDELDRCNPHYAVKVLERIKHLFCISNVVFVLSIDKEQLENSIRGYYGSDRIDAGEYLRRFIDVEYILPEPDVELFCKYLFDIFGFNDFFVGRSKRTVLQAEEENFKEMSKFLFENLHFSLRQMEKIYANMRLILCTFDERMPAYPGILLLLLYIRMIDVDFYRKINSREVNVQEIVSFIERSFPELAPQSSQERKIPLRLFLFEVAKLLICYSMDRKTGDMSWELLSEEGDFLYETKMDKKALADAVKYYGERDVLRNSLFRNLSLLIEHVELVLPLLNTGGRED